MEKTFRRDIQSLDAIFDFLGSCASRYGLDESVTFTLKFAVEEIFTNMVKYNPLGPDDISIGLDVNAAQLIVRFIDFETIPFDVTKKKEPDLNLLIEQRKPGGLGLHLVKRMVDKIDYEHVGDKSTITLTMKLDT